MTAGALLDKLDAVGVHLCLAGDDLRYQTRAGVRIMPYRDRIQADKPALLTELLQRQIVAVVSVDSDHFDRSAYDALWRQWQRKRA